MEHKTKLVPQKKLILNKHKERSISVQINKEKYKKKTLKNSLSESILTEKNDDKINIRKNFVKIKNKGNPIFIPKKEFYKMKNLDLGQLKSYKNEKKEILKQKQIFLEKVNSIYNTDVIDLISEDKEKEYRKGISNIQRDLRNKKLIQKEELKNFYSNILNSVKNLKEQINYEKNKRINDVDERINININVFNKKQEKALDKKLESLNIVMFELKELIKKMENINRDYKKVKENVDIYIRQNAILKQNIQKQNEINKKLVLEMRSRGNKKVNESSKNNVSYFKKIKNDRKSENKNVNKDNSDILKRIKKLSNNLSNNNNSTINQTNCTTNNINLLSKRNKNSIIHCDSNNSYRNIMSTNYCNSSSFLTFNAKRKEQENKDKINNKEKNIIKNLGNHLERWKKQLNLIKKKLSEEIPQNPIYSYIENIIQNFKKEESDSVLYNIDNKLLTDNMRIFPYQSKIFRQIFMTKLFNDKNLYQIYLKQKTSGDSIFNKNIFDAPKKSKLKAYIK